VTQIPHSPDRFRSLMEAVWGMQGVGCSLEESGCSWFPMTRPLVSARARRPGVYGSVSTDQGAMDGSGVAGVNWTVTKRSLSVYDSSVSSPIARDSLTCGTATSSMRWIPR